VLIDDVLYTGRTVRAALDQLIDFWPASPVATGVLIDRGNEHRELPIQADYIGKLVPTKKSEIIKVMLTDFDEDEGSSSWRDRQQKLRRKAAPLAAFLCRNVRQTLVCRSSWSGAARMGLRPQREEISDQVFVGLNVTRPF